MKLKEAQRQFISSWGAFGSFWGISKNMAEMHALLLISPEPLSHNDLMKQLGISQGSTNINIRELISWGLVYRAKREGKKEFYTAEKDMWLIATRIMNERKKRELEPILLLIDQIGEIEGNKTDKNIKQFNDTIADIKKFGLHADRVLNAIMKAEEKWLFTNLLRLFK